MRTLVLVDGHNLLHRAAFGFPARITSRSGRDITLVFGFFALIRAAVHTLPEPASLVVVFDGQDGSAQRRSLHPDYKPAVAGDDEVFADLPRVHDGLRLLDVPCIQHDAYEADDVIATLVAGQDTGRRCLIMSTDQDFYQLLDDDVWVLNSARRADRRIVTAQDVADRFGVRPSQWCDYRALTGDKSDNIPGVRGVGPLTAARLLRDRALLEDLADLGRLAGQLGQRIRDCWDQVLKWRCLVQLRRDLPLAPVKAEQPVLLPLAGEVIGQLDLWS